MSKKPFNKKRGQGKPEVKEFDEEVIQISRVTRVVKGGRRLRFRATVAIGDKKGRVGIGIGKSVEVQGAIKKAVAKAKKDLVKINMYGDTIPHRIQSKFKSAEVLLIPASDGTGIIAGGPVRKVVELAGIKNILSKSLGSNNKINCVKATYKALSSLRFREEPGKATPEEVKKETPAPKKEEVEKPKNKKTLEPKA